MQLSKFLAFVCLKPYPVHHKAGGNLMLKCAYVVRRHTKNRWWHGATSWNSSHLLAFQRKAFMSYTNTGFATQVQVQQELVTD